LYIFHDVSLSLSLKPFPCKASANPTSRKETHKTSHEEGRRRRDMTIIESAKDQRMKEPKTLKGGKKRKKDAKL